MRTLTTTINASTDAKGGIRLAPATVFGTQEEFPPLVVSADTTSAAMELVYDDSTHYSGDVEWMNTKKRKMTPETAQPLAMVLN